MRLNASIVLQYLSIMGVPTVLPSTFSSPPCHGAYQSVNLPHWDPLPLLLNNGTELSKGGIVSYSAVDSLLQLVPEMFYGIHIRGCSRPIHHCYALCKAKWFMTTRAVWALALSCWNTNCRPTLWAKGWTWDIRDPTMHSCDLPAVGKGVMWIKPVPCLSHTLDHTVVAYNRREFGGSHVRVMA